MSQHFEKAAEAIEQPSPARRLRRFQRALAALVVAAGIGSAAATAVASPAGASTVVNGVPYVDCNLAFGAGTGNIHFGLSAGVPAGTTVGMYLYKWIWNGYTWTKQYQGRMDWAKKTDNLSWTQNGAYKDGLYILVGGSGYYFVQIAFWNPNGSYLGSVWSGNNCAF